MVLDLKAVIKDFSHGQKYTIAAEVCCYHRPVCRSIADGAMTSQQDDVQFFIVGISKSSPCSDSW